MLKVALKGLLTRKLRAFLTGFAVILGVAFVAGTFVFTDTIDASFRDLFERTAKGTDVSVQAHQAVEADFEPPPTMPADTLERVESVDGVEEAFGSVSSDVTMLDREGEPIVSQGPPTLAVTAPPERFDPFDFTEGGPPETADEVAIDKATSDKYDFHEGDTVTVSGATPAKQYTVTGVATVGDSENLAGARLVEMILPEAQRVTGHDGYDDISVAAEGGTSPEELKAAIIRELGTEDFAVRTGEEQVDKQAGDFSDALAPIRTSLLVFAFVAVLVGGFLIFNTFNITVAQRTREIALLRTLGASRPQVMRSVLAETFVIGLVASILGLLAGLLVAPGLRAMLSASGIELGTSAMELKPRTIIVGLLVGVIATTVSGFIPARRATRVEPIAAMRDAVTPGSTRLRRRRIVTAAVVELLGLAVMLYALFGDLGSANATASALGLGAVLMMFGFALIAPTLVRPMSSLIGRPLERVQGLTGRLARENARRQPARTAVTASALMIGVALVVFVTIFAASIRATIDESIDNQVRAAGIVSHEDGFSPLPQAVVEALRSVDGVEAVSPIRFETGKLVSDDSNVPVTGIDPATASEALSLEWQDGTNAVLSQLGDGDIAVNKDFADSHDLSVGSEVAFITPRGDEIAYRVSAIYETNAIMLGPVTVTDESLARDWESKDIAFALVVSSPGTDATSLKQAEEQALRGFPTAEPQTIQDFKDQQNQGINQLLGLIYGLLSLSIFVALLGVVNTLALSVHERTRELGMLRAVGMSKRQVRRMIRGEAVITAAIGAVLGTVLGIVFAAIISQPLIEDGLAFDIPIGALLVVFVIAAILGVLAAIQPARRAAKVDVLRAVTTE